MVGTASRVRRWLLIEQHGPWGRDALQESYLDAGIAARVAANAKEHGVRVLLTRRVGADRSAPRTVHLVRSDRDRRWIEQLVVADDGALAELDLSVLGSHTPPGVGEPGPEPLTLARPHGPPSPCAPALRPPAVP